MGPLPSQNYLAPGETRSCVVASLFAGLAGANYTIHSLAAPSVTNGLEHKIKKMLAAAFSSTFHRFLHVAEFTTLTGSAFNPTIHVARGDISWHPTHLCLRVKQSTRLAEAQSCSYPGRLVHPALELNVMILEGYHHSQSCWDIPHPIHGWLPTVQCGMQTAPSQASPLGWIYQATMYNSFHIGAATTTAAASATSKIQSIKQFGHWRSKVDKCYI